MLKEIYDKLLEQDYWPIKIYPLLKLYEYYEEQKTPEKFFGFIEKISPDYDTDQIKEFIICEKEGIPYDLFLENFTSYEKMKSIRKFLLENKDKKESYKIAKEFCGYWTSSQINQLRKFLICSNPMNMNDFNNLLSYIKNNNIHFWPILDVFFKVYSKLSIEEFWKFLKNKKTIEYIQLFCRNECSYEGDCIFFKFREYSLKHIENNY